MELWYGRSLDVGMRDERNVEKLLQYVIAPVVVDEGIIEILL
jgi:hypothetical protein